MIDNTIQISNEDFEKAAVTYRKDLLRLPIITAQKTLQYMTCRFGVRYEEQVGQINSSVEIAPYKPGRRTNGNIANVYRALRTYFGSVNEDFEPNSLIQTILGHMASQAMGDEQMNTPSAREVLGAVAKSVGNALNKALWTAVRNPDGDKTKDLFDGFDTITSKEITAGNIAVDKHNLVQIDEEITVANAVDVAKYILGAMDDELRDEQCYMYTTFDFYQKYCEAYKLTSGGIPYNNQYKQTFVEGSNNNLEIIPLSSKKGSRFIHVSPKANMLFGCDQMSDTERVRVKEFSPDLLTFMMRMFAGCQFESIDPRRLMVAKLA